MKDQIACLVKNELKTIPFVNILLPYTRQFLDGLKGRDTSIELVDKLHVALLQEMSFVAEVTLQKELDCFIKSGQNCYQDFTASATSLLETKYPVLDEILKRIASNYLVYIQKIYSNFSKDFNLLKKTFSLKVNENNFIKDIDTSLGDGHSGESTVLVTLTSGVKLIYKPRNIDSTHSYNQFIEWVNYKLDVSLKTIKCISCGSYGWLEFVAYEKISSINELQEYYYQAGILLATTLLLGSKDCHYENIIACGKYPVIIDHETIVQPVLSNQSISTLEEQQKVPFFSVLESMLIVNQETGVPLEHAGYGIKGNTKAMDLESSVLNPNTIDSKRDVNFKFRKLVKENVPLHKNIYVFANDYKSPLVEGFSAAYDMFIASREELLSDNSPVRFFENQKMRYVWRPTFIYFKILKYMRSTSFMSCFKAYESKLYELMSKAYRKGSFKSYRFILECEMKQILKGDIPIFNVDSLECNLEEGGSINIFSCSCIDNIKRRVSLLTPEHKNKQLEYIEKWLSIKAFM